VPKALAAAAAVLTAFPLFLILLVTASTSTPAQAAPAAQPATEKYTPEHLMATVMQTLFRTGELSLLVLSKVGNFALDLPDAEVLIQVSGTFGSRQEEAQRRISR
jgi:hypothetical protein